MKEFRKCYWCELALCASALSLIYSPIAYTADTTEQLIAAVKQTTEKTAQDVYTINFNNVSIIELIRFTSKISGLNFVFEEADLQFSVTVVSEEAVTAQGMLAALSQVLRMHDLTLLEQDSNVLITKSKKINQIPKIVSSDLPVSGPSNSALVTRVFRIKNASVTSIAAIIRPMISDTALIEVSPETRQLIVTDITTNVEQISALLTSLDAPHTPLEVDVYVVKNIPPPALIAITEQILFPFKEGNPLVLVPQLESNSIYIVSTPYLIERAMSLMEDLDVPASQNLILSEEPSRANKTSFFVYHPQHRTGEELEREIDSLAANLTESGLADPAFLEALDSMKWTPSTNSLVFTGDPHSIEKIQALLQKMDVSASNSQVTGFFLYKLQFVKCTQVVEQLKQLADTLSSSAPSNQNLIEAINTIKCIPANNSLVISGTTAAIDQLKAMIAEFDTKEEASILPGQDSFFIYKPQYLSANEIEAALIALTGGDSEGGLNDSSLIKSIKSMRYVKQTNSLIFIGSEASLNRIRQLLTTIDTSSTSDTIENIENVTFLLYKVQYVSGDKLLISLKDFALELDLSNISHKELIKTINSAKWIKDNNAILFTGNKQTLEQIDNLVKKFDVPGASGGLTPQEIMSERNASSFVIYTPRYLSGDELIGILKDFMQNLQQSGVSDPGLYDVINNLKWINKTASLLISGNSESIVQVQQLLTKFDIPQKEDAIPTIESIDNTSFLVYKLQYHPGNDIQAALKQVAVSLGKTTTSPTDLVNAIDSLQWIQVTNSILCTGSQDVLVRLKELIQNLDVPLRQVFIEVLIIQTTLSNQQNFGLQWGGQVKYMDKTVMQSGNFPVSQSNGSAFPSTAFPTNLQGINGSTFPNNQSIPFPIGTGFDLGVIGDIIMHKGKSFISLGSLMNAIQQDIDSSVVLNPKIVTQDNRQSTVFVGQNIPYTGSLVTNTGQNSTVSNANIEYRDVGVSLTITPLLGEGDIITMDIVQDISQVVQGTNVGTSNQNLTGIQTNHSHMETRVHVPDNHFVALSGMINDTKSHFKTGIPCLGGLPVIGAFFSENDRQAQKNNIIVFVRPQIVTSYQEYKAITEHQEWMFKDNARLPSLKEEFDEGIDLVKIPENE